MGVTMKKLGTMTAVALMMSVTAAYADGLSLKDAPADSGWGGMYLGGTIGYGWGSSDSTYGNPENGYAGNDDHQDKVHDDPSGLLGGITLGYNHQLNGRWVIGVEGDLSMADISGADNRILDNSVGWDDHYWQSGWGALFTLRGRVGYDMNGNLMYVTAGVAAVDSNEYIHGDQNDQGSDNTGWRGGYVVGFGVERKFSERWSGKVEYLHIGLSDKHGTSIQGDPYTFENDLDVLRVGLNYKVH